MLPPCPPGPLAGGTGSVGWVGEGAKGDGRGEEDRDMMDAHAKPSTRTIDDIEYVREGL